MYTALVIDDETLARKEIAILLRVHDNIRIVAEASNVADAVQAMRDLNPDIVFLDIQMGAESGFDFLDAIDQPCAVIFTTAYDQYAIRAFEVNALDYLLKPIEPERLQEAIRRLDYQVGDKQPGSGKFKYSDLVLAKISGRLCSFKVEDIAVIEAVGDYTKITTISGTNCLVKNTMKRWLNRLPQGEFFRVHRSTIVNMNHVQSLVEDQKDRYQVKIHQIGKPLPVSRRQAVELKKLLA